MKYLINFGWFLYLLIIFSLVATSIFSSPQTPGLYRAYVIRSGSMEPAIMTGDVILVNITPTKNAVGDVITFSDEKGRIVTHRILESTDVAGTAMWVTKGDNNQAPDPQPITDENIIGHWQMTLPKLGYMAVYSRKPIGMVLLVLTPILLYLAGEVTKDKPKSENSQAS